MDLTRVILRFFRLALVAALATAIAGGIIFRHALESANKAKLIKDLLKASYILSLGELISSHILLSEVVVVPPRYSAPRPPFPLFTEQFDHL